MLAELNEARVLLETQVRGRACWCKMLPAIIMRDYSKERCTKLKCLDCEAATPPPHPTPIAYSDP
jgi:hypothetical protein